MYRLSADARIELGKNAEAVMQRTQSSAEQFQATHLSGKAATLNVTPALGMFMICSEDRDWLDLLPEKFGSFQRGKVAADTMESPFDALA